MSTPFIFISILFTVLTYPFVALAQTDTLSNTMEKTANQDVFEYQWLRPPPCDIQYARPLPNQPRLGLSLWRFECPSGLNQVLSASISKITSYSTCNAPLAAGQSPSLIQCSELVSHKQTKPSEDPLAPEDFDKVETLRPISSQTPLLKIYFQPKLLWGPNSTIQVEIKTSTVTTKVQAQALGFARIGQPAQARLENGKTVQGIATSPLTLSVTTP